ncbi:uncharacterized protein CLUP02_10883 [Colletotrichum lupini]|uniref:Uncharacterized protein n=1 Tax=Colletotrichum lupini TaxID=145971 RepID=A0A9Q8WJA8_9PEZI|nr:uncharacterized protein CLUP02_10883 [Colletotrichum lupini]UQC85386.1 hypothetical protein CLUP02_10883 [Colletotrichum lupini]
MCLHAFPLRLHFKIAQPHSSVCSSRIQAFAIQTIPTIGTHCLKHNPRSFTNPSAQNLASVRPSRTLTLCAESAFTEKKSHRPGPGSFPADATHRPERPCSPPLGLNRLIRCQKTCCGHNKFTRRCYSPFSRLCNPMGFL